MIIFNTIRWKNFLSTGNQFTEIQLDKNSATLIQGSNGAGKSTMLDALCFGLFNKPFRKINKPQLVNTINEKDCVVEIEFSIGNTEFKVVRSIKPNKFEIYENGQLVDQESANKDYQKYLEQSILKINYKSFTQVVILGSSTFVPFMQLPAAHRREVIEDLLDIGIFSRMNALLKDRIKDVRDELKDCDHSVSLAEQKYNLQKDNIANLEKVNKNFDDQLVTRYENNEKEIDAIYSEIQEKQKRTEELVAFTTDQEEVEKKFESLKEVSSKLRHKSERVDRELEFFTQHESCPTCKQDISADLKDSKTADLTTKKQELKEGFDQMSKYIKAVQENVKIIREYNSEISELNYEIQSLKRRESRLTKQQMQIASDRNAEKPDLEKEYVKLKQDLDDLEQKQTDCAGVRNQQNQYKIISNLLKDGGIKSQIIKKYVPVINKLINKYLTSMDFYVNFTLDEEFNEVIKSRFRDEFSYASFSEGEKQKIDLALLFTWREVAKLKNSVSTNLLILDEVFDSSLDTSGTEELLKILKDISGNTNVFVISHKGEILSERFPNQMRFEKVSDFSKCVDVT
jgi:DNA repair exonuclease SbcCD ATPase subunit